MFWNIEGFLLTVFACSDRAQAADASIDRYVFTAYI